MVKQSVTYTLSTALTFAACKSKKSKLIYLSPQAGMEPTTIVHIVTTPRWSCY